MSLAISSSHACLLLQFKVVEDSAHDCLQAFAAIDLNEFGTTYCTLETYVITNLDVMQVIVKGSPFGWRALHMRHTSKVTDYLDAFSCTISDKHDFKHCDTRG